MMDTVKFFACMGLAAAFMLQAACGEDALSLAQPEVGSAAITVDYDATGLHLLEWNGVNLLEGTGGYYIIGTCTGADDEFSNVISNGSDGQTLHAPGACPGAPFSLSITGTNPMRVSIQIGPLPVAYAGLSVPFDPKQTLFESFAFSSSGYVVGCGASWSPRTGSGARFDTIPQPCTIPGHGAVGVARVTSVPDGMWAEITGSVARCSPWRRRSRCASQAPQAA